jgi:hypothetical protein
MERAMKRCLLPLVLTLGVSSPLTGAAAQARLSTPAMSCGQASSLVASAGGIVLGTGGFTYDRFVRDRGFCLITEVTEPAWVPARDTPQCVVGYRCRERLHKRS